VLDDAEAFVTRMPTDKLGLLFLQAGKVMQPDPDRLDSYQTHAGQIRGHWRTSAGITAAMFERYNKNPTANQNRNPPLSQIGSLRHVAQSFENEVFATLSKPRVTPPPIRSKRLR
jgi:hypothetical protein